MKRYIDTYLLKELDIRALTPQLDRLRISNKADKGLCLGFGTKTTLNGDKLDYVEEIRIVLTPEDALAIDVIRIEFDEHLSNGPMSSITFKE